MQNENYQTVFRRLLAHQQKLVVAFSGGLDSTVLLHLLLHWPQRVTGNLRVIHIHHGISPFADSWVQHCQALCEAWQVPLQVLRVHIEDNGSGLEAQARQARYTAFAKALQPAEALVCAHHLDDQSETLLLALKRGSGPAGLAAMPESLPFAGTVLLRPLLSFPRTELAHYAQHHGLSWIEDESNQDCRFDRNFLRQQVLPVLHQRWPHLSSALARSAQLCGEQEQLLDELLADELAQLIQPDGSLSIAPLCGISDIRRTALLRRWVAMQDSAPLSRAALAQLWQEVALSRQDAKPRLRVGNHEVRRFQQALWWVPCHEDVPDLRLDWLPPFAPLHLPQDLGQLCLTDSATATVVRAPKTSESVTIRFRAPGIWHIAGRSRGRSLKKICHELAVPPWQRGNIPLVFYNEQLITATGLFVTREGLPIGSVPCWNIDWQCQRGHR